MKKKDRIEIARNILANAADLNLSKETLLKISRKIDRYVVEYYRKSDTQKEGDNKSEKSNKK